MDLRLFICLIFLANLRISRGQNLGCLQGRWQCDDGKCIPNLWRCDGQGDCLDGSDEMDCTAPRGSADCPPGQFACVDSVGCVDASARCDGQAQCPTGSDEENCPATKSCLDSDWTCRNRICIPKELRCNGQNDCMDNSDEQDCGEKDGVCREDGIRCPEGTCLSAEKKCDGQIHCSDGSDEPTACGRICSVGNGGCSHVCTDESWGALCACPVGYKLSPNGADCEDLNECAPPFAPCAHHCTNTVGSYYCHCREGFKLEESSTCVASGNATQLLMVQRGALALLNAESQQFELVQTSVSDPVALAFDVARGWYYWADGHGNIYKTDGKGSWTAYSGKPGIKGLACDWLNGNLFWTNQKTESIYMQAADGTSYTSLLSKDISPSELVLLPVESLMFWINAGPGDRGTVEKSWMDGSGRSSLAVLTAQSAHSLTADVAARRLYWISDFKKSMETVKVDGTGRYSVTGLFNRRPALSLAVFGGLIYWVDDRGLWQGLQNQPSQRKFLWKADLPLLAVYHNLQQPQGTSACVKTPCDLCQLTKGNPAGFTCACPNSKVLLLDGTCENPRFMYATITSINLLEFRGKESTKSQLFTTDGGILSFDMDWFRDWLYWANHTGHVQRTSLTQVKTELVSTPLPVCLITVDQRSGNLYWVSCDQNNIGTSAADNQFPRQLYHTTKEIQSLYLDWVRDGIFWLEEERILSMSMVGGKVKELLHIAGGIRGSVAFDLRASSLIWNSERAGLTTLSLQQERSHQAGRRWSIPGSVVAAFEPFLLSLSDKVMKLWDRRDGSPIQDLTVPGHVLSVIAVLRDIEPVPSTPVCNEPSVLCRRSSVCLSPAQLCDGNKDCPDGDDEELCVDTCPSKEDFKCTDGSSCVSTNLMCDGRSHCHDGSDEVNCPTAVASPTTETNILKCRTGSKLCRDGTECVLYSHVCDGEEDCTDGSDEEGCDVAESVTTALVERCPYETDFRCKDRRSCVSKSQVCDGRAHCLDGSDEVDCPSVARANVRKCLTGSKPCRDGTECVLYSHMCDGEKDCTDGSDEEGCDAPQQITSATEPRLNPSNEMPPATTPPPLPACSSPSVLCPSSSVHLCISPSQFCNGRKDCPDGFDEKNCVKRCPSKNDFRCRDRRSCVSKSLVCDGRSHCHDGSDEVDCPTVAPPAPQERILKCRVGSRLCQDGTECVLLSHVCDGEKDCKDGSDEEGCEVAESVTTALVENLHQNDSPAPVKPFAQPPIEPSCTSPSVLCPGSSLCINPTQLCDGKKDCPDGSDEQCVERCPYETDFRCKDRRSCVSKSQVCDGRAHCLDGSDEVDCPSVGLAVARANVRKCRMGSKPCRDGTECVLYSHVCDGEKDCTDGSDEEGCDAPQQITSATEPRLDPSNEMPPAITPPPLPACSSPSVLCPSSSVHLCISPSQFCNGRKDCPDGFDEKNCVKRCPSKNDFRCRDRRSCVSKSLVCDGRSHCHDGSDEVDCPTVAPPAPQERILKCRVGSRLCQDGTECVLLSHVCDGEKDCNDGSDEEGCEVAESVTTALVENLHQNDSPAPVKPFAQPPIEPSCTSPSVLCPGSSLCINPTQLCDGKKDCPDGSDEQCVERCPYETDFRCKDRRSCVSKSQVCDGRAHCLDGSDEVDCPSVGLAVARANVRKCRMGSKPCRDGTECVLYSHVCDGEKDCTDGSDEEGCDAPQQITSATEQRLNPSNEMPPATTPPPLPACSSPSVLCPSSSVHLCISPSQFCNGRKDCPDGFDEKNCVKRCPSKNDFRCKDRRSCVSKSLVCDGRSHCHDGSDEVDCPTIAPPAPQERILKCRVGSRLCQDGTECVLSSHVCDGEKDCNDGSDEEGCDAAEPTTAKDESTTKPACTSPSVPCPGSSVCIDTTQLCDGKKDCPDGSDENCVKKCPYKTDFLCKDRRSCVSESMVCDGRSHCHDGSDEFNCRSLTGPAPQANVLRCRYGARPCEDGTECVLYSHVCDGEKDCVDGSDEQGCPEACKQGEFQCSHGKMCIPAAQVCDGKAQCRDQSDELACQTQTKSCEHQCADGKRCIPKKFLCDGERDCLDGSDEVGCNPVAATESPVLTSASTCVSPSVPCPGSALCITQNQLCDGQRDCPDGFDENNCVVQCENPDDFLCRNKRQCVRRTDVCDGRAHCADGSDERQCQSADPAATSLNDKSAPLKCRKGFKPCKDGLECIMYSHVCDGEQDCRDGSDEEGCAVQCKAGEFQCSHGKRCIPQEQVCDGQNDCQDRSDEMDCSHLTEGCHHLCDGKTRCIPDTFLCDGERDCADGSDEEKCGLVTCAINEYRCASGQCVSEALRCDGYADCSDRSDEVDCTRPPRCPTQLRCPHSHECLQKEWLCDGEDDCKDGSDEKNCNTPPAQCREYQWKCGESSQCIPLSWRCDGKADCYNGVDEYKCSQKKCPSHLYQCGSRECVDASLVCNRLNNCADSSDEGMGCAQHNCSSVSAPQCDHHCVSTPNGPRCYCTPGFRLQSNGVSCVDIDECNSMPNAVCKHICLNTRGSYTCHCFPGFYQEPDNKSCKTKDEPLLLASVQSDLLLMGVHSGTLHLLSSASRPVFSLDYHWAQQRVYWLSPDYQSIRWADMKNSNNKGTLIKGVKSDFIAVDWVGKNLYWVDGLVGQILAVKLSDATVRSQDYTVVLGEDLEQPSSLVLLPHRGLMLWSEIGSTPQIERSGMDGSKRKVVVSRNLSWPVSLAFDLLDNRVYWADEKLRCIGSASLDGDNIKILQLAETPSPFSVAVFNDRVFWSDTKRRTVRSADKNTGKDQKVLLKRPGQPFGLKLMHALSQPAVSSPCDSLHCSHLCLLAPEMRVKSGALWSPAAPAVRGPTAVCRCPKGLLLSKDKITCTLPKETSFILLLARKTVYQIPLSSIRHDGVALKKMPNSRVFTLPGVNEAVGLDVSIQELSVYVAYSGQGSVDVLRLSSSRSRQGLTPAGQILKLKDDSVTALAVDWVTSNLYWSSSRRPDIHVTSRHGGYTTSLLQGSLMGTTSIALHPPSGRLCYTALAMASGKSQTEVDCAWMDGRNKAVLWKESTVPSSLVFSSEGTVIYWADTGEGVISSIGVDGSKYKQYKTGPGLLISFTHTANILLWVTLAKDVTKLWFSDGLQPKQLWFETKTSLVEVRAYSIDSQSGSNSCSSNNSGCDHLCLPYPGGRTCTCGRGFYSINATSCAPLPSCPAGEESCFDSSKCISSSKFCDGHVDCPDQSDEQDCPDSNSASFGTKASDGRSSSSPDGNTQTSGLSVKKDSASCDLQHCNNHGNCIKEGKVTRCQCLAGYKGEFCQEAESGRSHVPMILGIFFLCAVLTAAVFIYSKRRQWASIRSRSIEKETLMANMGLPFEHYESDSEELDSPVDVKNPPVELKAGRPQLSQEM